MPTSLCQTTMFVDVTLPLHALSAVGRQPQQPAAEKQERPRFRNRGLGFTAGAKVKADGTDVRNRRQTGKGKVEIYQMADIAQEERIMWTARTDAAVWVDDVVVQDFIGVVGATAGDQKR